MWIISLHVHLPWFIEMFSCYAPVENLCQKHVSVCYLVYESVGQMEESHHSTPVDAISKDAPGHLHEDVLSTVALNLVDQSDRKKLTHWNVI